MRFFLTNKNHSQVPLAHGLLDLLQGEEHHDVPAPEPSEVGNEALVVPGVPGPHVDASRASGEGGAGGEGLERLDEAGLQRILDIGGDGPRPGLDHALGRTI